MPQQMRDNSGLSKLMQTLQTQLTPQLLKEITAHIIAGYKAKKMGVLAGYAKRLDLDTTHLDVNRIFSKLIHTFHPDKLAQIQSDIARFYRQNNLAELKRINAIYLSGVITNGSGLSVDYEEEYAVSETDFNQYGIDYTEGFDGDIFTDFDDIRPINRDIRPNTFYEALNEAVGGTDQYRISVYDMNQMDGEIDLSDYHINDLDGVDSCLGIQQLNLSKNHIQDASLLAEVCALESLFISENELDDLSFVESLTHLIELDISFNHISDLSALLHLPKLEYVNIIGNPVVTHAVVDQLKLRGVLVVD